MKPFNACFFNLCFKTGIYFLIMIDGFALSVVSTRARLKSAATGALQRELATAAPALWGAESGTEHPSWAGSGARAREGPSSQAGPRSPLFNGYQNARRSCDTGTQATQCLRICSVNFNSI